MLKGLFDENTINLDILKKYKQLALEKLHTKLKNGENFTFVKYGDGEIICMSKMYPTSYNCDRCTYDTNLGDELKEAYIFYIKNKNTTIAKWDSRELLTLSLDTEHLKEPFEEKFCYYNLLIHKLPFENDMIAFFKEIKKSKRKKIYVCNSLLAPYVKNMLNVDSIIQCPMINSHLNADDIFISTLDQINNNGCIILTSCGMFAKVLIYELMRSKPNNTYIDVGSSFDGICYHSRNFNGVVGYKNKMFDIYINDNSN